MPYLILIVVLLVILFGPQIWVQHVLRKYNVREERFPGTGGELAQHLVDRFKLEGVEVEEAGNQGDHYDPLARKVRLDKEHINNKSLAAIAIAAHEVGHAIQHHRREPLLDLRTRLGHVAIVAQKISGGLLMIIPIVTAITRAPSAGIAIFAIGLASMLLGTIVTLLTLPVEIDASFNKALPILKEGKYIEEEDEKAVTHILRAAALTYLAASLASLLNIWRWIAIFRR